MGETKTWRITDEHEFLVRADKYLSRHLKEFIENMEDSIHSETKARSIWNKYESYRENEDKFSLEAKVKGMLSIVLEDVKNWGEFSSDPKSTLDDIMLRFLISRVFGCSYASYLIISSNPYLTEAFIEDCIYVSSDLFKFSEWDDEHVKAVTDCAASKIPENKCDYLVELYGKKRLSDKAIPIRLNLSETITYRRSGQYINKYQSYIDKK